MHLRYQPSDFPSVYRTRPDLHASMVVTDATRRYELTGQLPYGPDGAVAETMAEQAEMVIQNISNSLDAMGLVPADVVRINIYTSDMDAFLAEALDIVFGYFSEHKPVSTLVGVARLPNPRTLISIEVAAAK